MTLGHRVAVLNDAQLQQCDSPRALYDRPVNTFVAGFIGSPSMNLCRVPLGSDGCALLHGVRVPLPEGMPAGLSEVVLGLRPESLELVAGGDKAGFGAQVKVVEELGAD